LVKFVFLEGDDFVFFFVFVFAAACFASECKFVIFRRMPISKEKRRVSSHFLGGVQRRGKGKLYEGLVNIVRVESGKNENNVRRKKQTFFFPLSESSSPPHSSEKNFYKINFHSDSLQKKSDDGARSFFFFPTLT
jgi:hypothetical protein